MLPTKELSAVFSEASDMATFSTPKMIALIGNMLQSIPQKFLQQFVLTPRGSGNAINLDTDKVNGVFSVYSCTGTKPFNYGIVFQLGNAGDWYQFAVSDTAKFYARANVNNTVGVWKLIGGGVNRYSSAHYAILQKGGLRDDADEGTYQRASEEQDGADCIGKRILYGFQHMLRCRKLHMLSRNDSQLSPGGATLWHAESGGVGRVQHADIHRKVRPYINHGPDVYRVRSFYKQLQTLGANIDITRLLALGKEVVAA